MKYVEFPIFFCSLFIPASPLLLRFEKVAAEEDNYKQKHGKEVPQLTRTSVFETCRTEAESSGENIIKYARAPTELIN